MPLQFKHSVGQVSSSGAPLLVEHMPDGFLVAFVVAFIAFIGCRTSGDAGFLVAFMAFIAFTAVGMVKRNKLTKRLTSLQAKCG